MLQSRESTICLTIRNNRADLAMLSAALDRFGVEHGVPRESLVDLQVALDEIVSNVIKYAWPEGGTREVSVRMTARKDAVDIEVIDDGEAFNPLSVAPPKRSPGRKPRIGGVGIHMVKQLMDRVEYARTDGRNHMIFTKRCILGVPPPIEEAR
jgi:anti-sigma regulatory factor (Ser/Thr protein kinase)